MRSRVPPPRTGASPYSTRPITLTQMTNLAITPTTTKRKTMAVRTTRLSAMTTEMMRRLPESLTLAFAPAKEVSILLTEETTD